MKTILRSSIFLVLLVATSLVGHATDYYVAFNGSDTNFGTAGSPWKTITRALIAANNIGDKIYVGPGTFEETGALNFPVGVSLIGSGISQTMIRVASSYNWVYNDHIGEDYAQHFLINANSTGSPSTVPQSFENFTIDGNGKLLHGGIMVVYRANILVQNVKVLQTGFCAIWFNVVQNSIIRNVQTKDCAWSNGWSSGAINVGNIANVEIDNVNIDEYYGYGLKSLPNSSTNSNNYISGLNVHHSRFSVHRISTWKTSANITLELWGTEFPNSQIHHNYFDNIVSLVNVKNGGTDFPHHATTPGMKVFDNTFNLLDTARSQGFGYGLECSINDVEIYGNKFHGGDHGIISFEGHKHYNWKIHRNYFYDLNYHNPTAAVQIDGGSGQGSVEDLTIVNNTMEMTNSSSANFFSAAKQGQTINVVIKNNLIINNRPAGSGNLGELNRVIRLADNSSINTLTMQNNDFVNIPAGNTSDLNKITSGNISNNLTVTPNIFGSGNKPLPYYELTSTSSLINSGSSSFSPNTAPAAYTFSGPNPDIGAFEYSAATIPVSSVSLSPSSPSIEVNNTVQLTAAISPSNATNQTIASWVSSNIAVATVNSSGLVTGISTGQATITVTTQDGNKTATATVTVTASTAGQNLVVNPEFDNGTSNWNLGNWIGPNYTQDPANTLTSATGAGLSGNNSARINIVSTNTAEWTLQLNQQVPLLQNGKTYEVSFMAKADANRTIIATAHGSNPTDTDYSPYTANLTTSAQSFSYTFTYGGTIAHTQFSLAFYVAHATSTADVWIDKVSFRDITNLVLVNSVSVTPTTASISVGATQQLTATVLPANATNKSVTWSSSNTSVATVSATGLVSALAAGSATITVTTADGNKTATSAITVEVPVASVSVSPTTASIATTATQQLTATVLPANATNKSVTWSSSNTSVATVSAAGLVSALTAGSATITVTSVSGNKTATSAITVVVPVASVSVSPTTASITTTTTQQLTATVLPANATNKTVTWSSSNTSIATVNSTGLVSGVAVGSATITVTTVDGNKTATSTITVRVPVTGVSVSPTTVTLTVNGTQQLTKTIAPANATNQNVTWSSSNTGVATVNSSGLVTAVAAGNATITVTTQEASFIATTSITVNPSIITNVDNAVLGTGTNQNNYTGTWTHGSLSTFFNNSFSYSNTTNNTVTITFNGSKVEWYTEKKNTHGIAAVSIDNGAETMVDLYAATEAQQVMVYASPVLTEGAHTFKIRVTGTKNAASSNTWTIHDFIKIYSSGVAVTGVSVSPTSATILVAGTQQLTKTISPANATNQNVTWSSSNASVATVSSTGLVTAVNAGVATITATTQQGAFTATSTITVNAVTNVDNAVLGTGTNQNNYTGSGWTTGGLPTFYNNTFSYSNTVNNAVTIAFTGNKIEWYTEKKNTHGIAAVSIDNGSETMIDLYSTTEAQQVLVFTSSGLTQSAHTFKIRVTGTKNASSSNTWTIHDYVKIYSSTSGGGGGYASLNFAEQAEEIVAYPNPVNRGEVLFVELPEGTTDVKVIDPIGRTRQIDVVERKASINTSGMAIGLHILRYRNTRGSNYIKILID